MKEKHQLHIHIILLFLAGIALEVFCVLLAFLPSVAAKDWLKGLILYGGSLLVLVLLLIGVVGALRGKEVLAKTCFLTQILLLLAAVVFYIIVKTGFIEVVRDEEEFRAFLERAGVWMSIVFIAVQFLQVVILPIPSTVTVVAGSALFGPLLGSVYSLIGIVLGSFTAFAVGRFAGYRVVAWLVGKETIDKWLNKIKGKDKIFLSAMFVLPVFPDDVLCFVAGLSSMSFGLFAVVIVLSRILAIFTTSYSVSLIPFDTWWGLLGAGVSALVFNSIRDGATVYYFKYYVVEAEHSAVTLFGVPFVLSGLYLAVGQAANILGVILAAPVSNRIGKKRTYMASMAIATVLSVAFYWLDRDNLGMIFLFQVLISICAGSIFPILWSMYADCTDYSELRTGNRATGLIFSSSSMSQKFGWAIGSAVTGWLLHYFGFRANEVQSVEAINGIKMFLSFLPAVGTALSVFFISLYPLSERRMQSIMVELENKRASSSKNQ